MASVPVELIREWEHRAWRFIDAYKEGLGAKDAHDFAIELEFRLRQQTCPLADFDRDGHLAFGRDTHGELLYSYM